MEKDPASHAGLVVGVGTNKLYVRLMPLSDKRQCSSCAMAFACKSADEDGVTVEVEIPDGIDARSLVGRKVSVVLMPGAAGRATVALLLFPLVVFLAVVVAGSVFGLEAGLTGLAALAAAVLSYIGVSRSRLARKPAWRLNVNDNELIDM